LGGDTPLRAAHARSGELTVARRDLLFLIPLGIVGIGAFYLLYFFTVRESTVGTAAILLYSSPAFVALLALIFLKETLGLLRLLALALTFGGIFLVVGGYDPGALEVSILVLTTGLLSGLTYGLYSIFGKPIAGHLEPAVILSYALGFGSLLLVLAALPTFYTLVGLSSGSYVLLFMLAVVHTALAVRAVHGGLETPGRGAGGYRSDRRAGGGGRDRGGCARGEAHGTQGGRGAPGPSGRGTRPGKPRKDVSRKHRSPRVFSTSLSGFYHSRSAARR
jgi:hypothetical protein